MQLIFLLLGRDLYSRTRMHLILVYVPQQISAPSHPFIARHSLLFSNPTDPPHLHHTPQTRRRNQIMCPPTRMQSIPELPLLRILTDRCRVRHLIIHQTRLTLVVLLEPELGGRDVKEFVERPGVDDGDVGVGARGRGRGARVRSARRRRRREERGGHGEGGEEGVTPRDGPSGEVGGEGGVVVDRGGVGSDVTGGEEEDAGRA